jgi:hypothetical protein
MTGIFMGSSNAPRLVPDTLTQAEVIFELEFPKEAVGSDANFNSSTLK